MKIKFNTDKDEVYFIVKGADLLAQEKNLPEWKIEVQWFFRDGRDLIKLKTLEQDLVVSYTPMGLGPNGDKDFDVIEEWIGVSLNGSATLQEEGRPINLSTLDAEVAITLPGRKKIRLKSGSGAHFSWGSRSGLRVQAQK